MKWELLNAMDISFNFNNEVPPKEGEAPRMSFGGQSSRKIYSASHNFAELWNSFARTGKPAAKGAPEWQVYNLEVYLRHAH